jgi:hypothetical protein
LLTIVAHFLVVPVVRVMLSANPCWFKLSFLSRVLMLRRAAAPTDTDIRMENSHMVNEAFEMTTDLKPMSFNSNISTDGQAQP